MGFLQAIKSGFRNYFNFSGRSSRSEYWYWILFICFAFMLTVLLFSMVSIGFVTMIDKVYLVETVKIIRIIQNTITIMVPLSCLSVAVRRLHDINFRGWWLVFCVTGAGFIIIFIFHCLSGTKGDNRFGPDPLQKTTDYPAIKEVPNPSF